MDTSKSLPHSGCSCREGRHQGGQVPDAWKDKPAKLRQKDRGARWTVKFSKAKVVEDGKPQQRDIAIPTFGNRNQAAIDRRHGFIRGWNVTSASAYDGARLRNVRNRANSGPTIWADIAYGSRTNEEWLRLRHPPEEVAGGNFGVVARFLFQLRPVSTVFGGPIAWDQNHARTIMKRCREFLPQAPEDLGAFSG